MDAINFLSSDVYRVLPGDVLSLPENFDTPLNSKRGDVYVGVVTFRGVYYRE